MANLFPAASIAAATESKADYIRHRAFDDAHYKQLVLEYLHQFGSASRQDLERLLTDKLSDALSAAQKRNKIQNLLARMSRHDGSIIRTGPKQQAVWRLVELLGAAPQSKIAGQE